MASKRHSMIDYAGEQTSSEEEDDMLVDPQEAEEFKFIAQQQQQHQARPGRPRKPSFTNTNSSMETITAPVRRRGRGPSKRPCLNRNALMARENRQRKKEYIERIEAKLQNYQAENQELSNTIQKQNAEMKRLNAEVTYLKSVLKNQTMITTLLKAMNDSLGRMHGDGSASATAAAATVQQPPTEINASPTSFNNNGMATTSSDVLNWVVSGQTNSSKTNNFSGTTTTTTTRNSTGVFKSDNRRTSYAKQAKTKNPVKIARKTMPFTVQNIVKNENPPSVESIFEDEDQAIVQKSSSSQSGSFCEYNSDKGSVGHDNRQPTTPMSAMSNSMDKAEAASLSNTDDFSQLSMLNVDNLFDNFDDNSLQFEQSDLFGEETLFHSLDKDPASRLASTNNVIDPLDISKMSEAINEKEQHNIFDSLDNAGVCLHINSTRVSLEYCSICHFNSLKSEIA